MKAKKIKLSFSERYTQSSIVYTDKVNELRVPKSRHKQMQLIKQPMI